MMIPITRKEKYINEIVGGGNTAPETPQTREEIFFADILGEVVAPSPVTRAEKYLAKIANKYSGELPEPVTRIERFLAWAAGMDVTIPTPITREEMFWSDYTLIVEKEISGIPPLTFNAIAGMLKNHRIYGNTVNGESVGDKTNNLLSVLPDGRTHKGITYENKNNLYMQIAGKSTDVYSQTNEKNIFLQAGTYYIRFFCDTAYKQSLFVLLRHSDNKDIVNEFGNGAKFTLENDESIKIIIGVIQSNVEINTNIYVQIAKDIKPSAFEPYGYRVPVTVTNGTDTQTTNIYLTEQLKIVGNEAEYIDFMEQKQHFADGTSADVTLPAMPTLSGTNTLTVGTEVQPSNVYIKYEGER